MSNTSDCQFEMTERIHSLAVFELAVDNHVTRCEFRDFCLQTRTTTPLSSYQVPVSVPTSRPPRGFYQFPNLSVEFQISFCLQ